MEEHVPDFFSDISFDWNSGLTANDEHKCEDEFEDLFKELEEAGYGSNSNSQDSLYPNVPVEETTSTSTTEVTQDVVQEAPSTSDIPSTSSKGDPKFDKITDIGTFVKELADELSILTFFQNKCLIRNTKFTNYLRVAKIVNFMQVQTQLKKRFKTPYITAQTESGYLAVPSAEGAIDKDLPYQPEDTNEWKMTDLSRLEMCVYNAFYHHKHFLIESRFQQMLLDMGFNSKDLNQIYIIMHEMDQTLWDIIKNGRISEASKKTKYSSVLENYLGRERQQFSILIDQHIKNKAPLFPYVLKCSKDNSQYKLIIDLKDLIAWKQHETRLIFANRFNQTGKLELSEVDWLMVEKEMVSSTNRTENDDGFKRVFEFNKSDTYNHAPMGITEFNDIKKAIRDNKTGLDWVDISKRLGTGRSPIRIFQTYKNYLYKEEISFTKTMEEKMAEFLQARNHLGHAPRIMSELSKKFGDIHATRFASAWQGINPKFAQGRFLNSEDAALFVAMEIANADLRSSRQFSVIQHILPWRHCSIWRRRASYLFRNLEKWSIEEDELLLHVVKIHGLNWSGLGKFFVGRPKMACALRHQLLMKKLKTVSLKQYHALYGKRDDRSVFGLIQLACEILQKIVNNAQESCDIEMIDISSNIDEQDAEHLITPPSTCPQHSEQACLPTKELESNLEETSFNLDIYSKENEKMVKEIALSEEWQPENKSMISNWSSATLEHTEDDIRIFLETLDKGIILQTINRLTDYLKSKCTESSTKLSHNLTLNCDKRKFSVDDPVSVASALTLRQVPLKTITRKMWATFSEFEKNVCRAYQIFQGGIRTKKNARRHTIPTGLELSFLPCVRNLLLNPKGLTSVPLPWMSIASPLSGMTQIRTEIDVDMVPFVCTNNIAGTSANVKQQEVELVNPNGTFVEALHRLSRHIFNSSTSTTKVKSASKKMRRKALNKVAAKVRWTKKLKMSVDTIEVVNVNEDQIKSKPKQSNKMWYDILLKKYGNNYTSGNLIEEVDETLWKESNRKTGGPRLLNVLHDHSYAPGHLPWVQNVVEDIQATVHCIGEGEDSAKENDAEMELD